MTNREYIEQNLTNEELAYFIYNGIINIGKRSIQSTSYVADWFGKERNPDDIVWIELERVKEWL